MSRLIDLSERSFGRWKVLERDLSFSGAGVEAQWLCRCECGSVRSVKGTMLTPGRSKSCGCLSRDLSSERLKIHGLSKSPTYKSWCGMKQRCSNPKNPSYGNYGGRGIEVCKRWEDSFLSFLEDMGKTPGRGFSLDRINNNGNYEPGNCRWADAGVQRRNSRQNNFICIDGVTKTLIEWSRHYGVKPNTAWMRLSRGKSTEEVFAK